MSATVRDFQSTDSISILQICNSIGWHDWVDTINTEYIQKADPNIVIKVSLMANKVNGFIIAKKGF